MRTFYEAWSLLDANSAITIAETNPNSAIAIAELDKDAGIIDIHHAMSVPNAVDFPVEDFFRVPFTHHVRIIW